MKPVRHARSNVIYREPVEGAYEEDETGHVPAVRHRGHRDRAAGHNPRALTPKPATEEQRAYLRAFDRLLAARDDKSKVAALREMVSRSGRLPRLLRLPRRR